MAIAGSDESRRRSNPHQPMAAESRMGHEAMPSSIHGPQFYEQKTLYTTFGLMLNIRLSPAEPAMIYKGIEFSVTLAAPDIWRWQFRIGDTVKTGRTEARLSLLAIRRVQLRIDRELKRAAQEK